MILLALNPYFDARFGSFFLLLLQRFFRFLTGNLSVSDLAPDEVQILVLCAVAVSGALVGCFLVLRRMVMLANAISHTILVGIVAAFLLLGGGDMDLHHQVPSLQAMLIAALVTGLATTFLTEFCHKVFGIQEDAATGLVFSTLFALGIILVTLFTRNAHIGAEVVMGNVDILYFEDLQLVSWILLGNLVILGAFFKEFKITTFDASLARALGIPAGVFGYLLMFQTSATVVAGFRAVGVLMILAFLTVPPLAARLLTHHFGRVLAYAVAIGIVASIVGVALSRHLLSAYSLALSTGGLVVCVLGILFLLALLFSPERGVLSVIWHRRRHAKAATG